MSRAQISKHYTKLAAQWPKDVLRPQVQFQNVLNSRVSKEPTFDAEREEVLSKVLPGRPARASELKEANALYLLLEDRYSKANPLPETMLRPKSDPEYYERLRKQLDETPERSWFSNLTRRLGGMVRLQ